MTNCKCWLLILSALIVNPPWNQQRWLPFDTKVKVDCWSSPCWLLTLPPGINRDDCFFMWKWKFWQSESWLLILSLSIIDFLPQQSEVEFYTFFPGVFKLKLKSLLCDLFYGQKPVLGKMVAIIYVIEWQKWGPPHAHILGICDNANKPKTIADYDCSLCRNSRQKHIPWIVSNCHKVHDAQTLWYS